MYLQNNLKILDKLEKISNEYGVKIHKRNVLINIPHLCPFNTNIGIINSKHIVIQENPDINTVCVLIHELGHCVFDKSKNFDKAKEFTWLIWEYIIAVECDIVKEWNKSNWNYSLGKDGLDDWGTISTQTKIKVLFDSWTLYSNLDETPCINQRMIDTNKVEYNIKRLKDLIP